MSEGKPSLEQQTIDSINENPWEDGLLKASIASAFQVIITQRDEALSRAEATETENKKLQNQLREAREAAEIYRQGILETLETLKILKP